MLILFVKFPQFYLVSVTCMDLNHKRPGFFFFSSLVSSISLLINTLFLIRSWYLNPIWSIAGTMELGLARTSYGSVKISVVKLTKSGLLGDGPLSMSGLRWNSLSGTIS